MGLYNYVVHKFDKQICLIDGKIKINTTARSEAFRHTNIF